jgi:hypothetical protein
VSLEELQQRLWRLITWPEGVHDALRRESPQAPPLETLIKQDERLAAEDRLDVYANAYFYRIHDVLAEDFPSLATALGPQDFHDLVTSYLAVHPSESASLRWIGQHLPSFLARHAAAASLRVRCPFAADLAAYEWATEAAFDALDSEAAGREELAAVPPQDWDALPIRLRPSVRLLELDWPVQRLRTTPRETQQRPDIDPAPTTLCLWRHDERVVHRELDALEGRALITADAGLDFGSLCVWLAEQIGEEEAPSQAAAWLARWIDDGLIRALPVNA